MQFPTIDIDRIAQDSAQATVTEMAQNMPAPSAEGAAEGPGLLSKVGKFFGGGDAPVPTPGGGGGGGGGGGRPPKGLPASVGSGDSISLGQVIAAIHTSINKGRSQADIATLQIAKMYKQDALLSTFPIPRVALAEISIELKCAIADAIPTETGLKGIKGKDLNVLVSAADLYHIPEDKITTMRMRFDETDCIWNESNEGGKASLKLVPS
eukprot:CAMPEP_0177648724 /NCGR_PEP_ID=MMETSP0447-20121125/10981_1 /TAXON_ID=0 /ORGANISM="Stygamoeba regulata, Strain BSH-02190019" /LENGTH=209 /DNA_ID=CAMNT_0019151385 /DNA_START=122 /DNA_END=751 /DNA_ORIENTATION=+